MNTYKQGSLLSDSYYFRFAYPSKRLMSAAIVFVAVLLQFRFESQYTDIQKQFNELKDTVDKLSVHIQQIGNDTEALKSDFHNSLVKINSFQESLDEVGENVQHVSNIAETAKEMNDHSIATLKLLEQNIYITKVV
ncbi:hypothetical protein MAR_014736 [Mya arenaria]|uniref:Uncharacterized protein n=1 Tax=Mya arenaria TaxID=6604 RepID=A0ABY7FGN5_MYAAR|nr:hypothetical protein MAR_014736 [Mya arenaria]